MKWTVFIFFWLTSPSAQRDMEIAKCVELDQSTITRYHLQVPVKQPGKFCVAKRDYDALQRGLIPNYSVAYVRY